MNRKSIDANWLNTLKQKCDIVSVLSKYIRLERKGKNFWACCPFHHEKTPSFSINEQEQFYHCFGCKESGDVITFVMKYESCDFYDAVEILAKSVGMEIPTLIGGDEIVKQKKQIDQTKIILEKSAKFFQDNLLKLDSTLAKEYLLKRKINKQSIESFRIGYSPNWTALVDFLKKQGYSVADMKLAGVVEEKNGRAYDVMAQRLVFPIINPKGEVIGFSARALEKTEFAKYKNTAQTLVFNKSKAIFGIDKVKAKKQHGSLDRIIMVEGQIDVITMHQFGFNETIATLGTALTVDHIPELKRYTDDIVLCFDGDEAGVKATLRAIDILNKFNIKVVSLPDKTDPDEFLYSFGKEGLEKLIANADDGIEYKIKVKAKQMKLETNDQRSKFVSEAIKILNTLQSNSQKYVYLKLISSLSGVPVSVLSADIENQGQAPAKQYNEDRQADDSVEKAQKFVFASLLHKKDYANLNFPKYVLYNPIFENLYDLLKKSKDTGEELKISNLYDIYDVENQPIINDIIYYNFNIIGNNAKQYYNDCVWTFCEYYLKEKQRILNEQFKDSRFSDQRKEILIELQKINKKLKNKNLEEDL